jgi:hypothetical protein
VSSFRLDQAAQDLLFAAGDAQPYDEADEARIIERWMARVDTELDNFTAAVVWGERKIIARQAGELMLTLALMLSKIGISPEDVLGALTEEKLKGESADKALEKATRKEKL